MALVKSSASIEPGTRLPNVTLGRLVQDDVESVRLHDIAAGRRILIVAAPGAFTPVCTNQHVPGFVDKADRLRNAGFDRLICVAPDNPWAVAAWAAHVDPLRKIEFFSDGNMMLARALRATVIDQRNFLGETCARYLLTARNGMIERFTIEPHPMELTCTRAEDVLELV